MSPSPAFTALILCLPSKSQPPCVCSQRPQNPKVCKDKLYPSFWVCHCYFNHLSLNYASLSAPAYMAHMQSEHHMQSESYFWFLAVLKLLLPLDSRGRSWWAPYTIQWAAVFTTLLSIQPHDVGSVPEHLSHCMIPVPCVTHHTSQHSTAKETSLAGHQLPSCIWEPKQPASCSVHLW